MKLLEKKSNFEKLLKNLEIVKSFNDKNKNSILTHINVVVMKSNYEELVYFPDFCEKYNIKSLRLDFLRPNRLPQEDIILNNRDISIINKLKSIVDLVEKKCEEKNIFFRCTFLSYLKKNNSYEQDKDDNIRNSEETLNKNKIMCQLPWKKLFIDVCQYGNVFPDCLCSKPIGNIFVQDINQIWNGIPIQVYRKRILNNEMSDWCSQACLDGLVDKCYMKGNNRINILNNN